VIAKTHTPEKSVVKVSSMGLKEVFDFGTSPENVKVGILNADNFLKTFKQLSPDNTSLDIDSDTTAEGNLSTEFRLYDKHLKFKVKGASMKIFKQIGKDIVKMLFDSSNTQASFRIDKDNLSKISSLCSLDSDNDTLKVSCSSGKVIFSGQTFEYELPGVSCDTDFSVNIYKKHYSYVDIEDTEVFVRSEGSPQGIIFKSLESDTQIIVGRVI
jgi:hypothetical protein